MKDVWFYWDGGISDSRLRILKDSVYSTRVFNPEHNISVISNSLPVDVFDPRFNIQVKRWDKSIFDNTPIDTEKAEAYTKANPRDFSDLFRVVLLYKYGGSYVDTDDLCIAPISSTKNIVCRSYDPHTSFYNKIADGDCVPGYTREIKGYNHINMFPRNDCWQNWEPEHPFILDMLTNEKFQNSKDVVWIGGEFSWQSISNETCIKWIDTHGIDWNYRLTLLYMFEDFVAHCSYWDKCNYGGEMCDIWKKMPNVNDYKWGEYKCRKEDALTFYHIVTAQYESLSHLWLHSKDMKEEWINEINETELYSPSTWILNEVREKINTYK